MSEPTTHLKRRRLRVPRGDGGVLLEPSVPDAVVAAVSNHDRLEAAAGLDLQGRTLGQMRQMARSELLASAYRYTSEFRSDITLQADPGPIIVTGHQPELFHPGVWVKNFAAAAVARQSGGTAINLVVDNDFCDSAMIRVPVPGPKGLRFERVTIADRLPPQPWEERSADPQQLATFASRVAQLMAVWNLPEPAADQMAFDQRPGRLADQLTRVRSNLEASRGLTNLELPISRLAETESFFRFVCHLLVNIERFHEVHNQTLVDYRHRNGLRSKTHPVPALETKDGWWETPFWTWREGDRSRQRLLAQQRTDNLLAISDGTRVLAELPLGPGMDACCAAEVLLQLSTSGDRIRPRALTNTIFSRMLFADLFIHGIGGAKYDEMTDAILSDFYGITPPEFMTCSATLHLLGDRATDATPEKVEQLQRQVRALKFRAEDTLADSTDPEIKALVDEKRTLIDQQNAAENTDSQANRARYRRFREINKRLAKQTLAQREELEAEIEATQVELQQNALLRSRDLSFALYPPARLWSLFDSITDHA